MKRRLRAECGFTLVEILIVIGIIALLAALLAVGFRGAKIRAQYESTKSLILALESDCAVYYSKYNAYPPSTPPGAPLQPFAAFGPNNSAPLLWYLGAPQPVMTGGSVVMQDPIHQFRRSDVEPATPGGVGDPNPANASMARPLVDAWGRRICFKSPGSNHASISFMGSKGKGRDQTKYFDAWSYGFDGISRGPTGALVTYSPFTAGAEWGAFPNSGYGEDDVSNWYDLR